MNQANGCYAKLPIVSSLHVFSMHEITLCCFSSSIVPSDLADFGRDPRRNNSFEREPKFCFFFCEVNNARFQQFTFGKILRHFNTTTSIGVAM